MAPKNKFRVSDYEEMEDQPQKSLYQVIGLEKTTSQQEIKKAYYKLALRLHPDKNPDDEEAKEKFQQLQKVISIIGDEENQALYDHTSCIDDDVSNVVATSISSIVISSTFLIDIASKDELGPFVFENRFYKIVFQNITSFYIVFFN
ncbi:unnamed protein product [Vicia faba]|uniref:J domain-containing protein n=1 Tax=Vicia faba TaxID=3906 RepID=A0AAV1AUR7_VICFA|nr:unnamed protein product [Vicia faba]